MAVTVLHGENQVLSRKALSDIKEQAGKMGKEVVSVNGINVELVKLKQAVESVSLFGCDRLVVVEGVRKEVVDYIKEVEVGELVVWEGKQMTAGILRSLGGEVKEFKVSPVIFKFTDSLQPENGKEMFQLWEECRKQDEVEMIFYMVCRQIRLLIQARSDASSLSGNPYVITKVKQQAKLFTMERLLKLHECLYQIDRGQKTGSTPLPLAHEIEMWLLSI